ncbi:MAG: protein BatD [Phaeodactylibacter sp.]|nr:protein BatD [Phaeodactylibacter sp.]
MMPRWIFAGLLLLSAFRLSAQVSFEASTEARTILLNSQFEVSFTLTNGRGRDFQPPNFGEQFHVLGGPFTQTSMQSINGQVTNTVSYVYYLQPKKTGHLTIGAASIIVQNKTMRTDPITLDVVNSKDKLKSNVLTEDEAFFFRAEPNIQEAYIGQEIILDFKLYVEASLTKVRHRMVTEPDYTGCFSQAVNWYRGFQEVVDGRQYRSWIVRRVILYPQQTGTISLEPAQLNLDFSEGQPSFGFFGNNSKRVVLRSEPVEIQVRPLPTPEPTDFIGLVGNYQLAASIDKRQLTTDDALTFHLNISGTGDMKRLQLPDLLLPVDTFEVYPPKITKEFTADQGGTLHHVRELEYLILPKVPGSYPLQTSFSYFSQDSAQYLTVRTEPTILNVRPGVNGIRRPTRATANQDTTQADIRFIYTKANFHKKDRYFFGSAGFWTLATLPILLFFGGLGWKRRQAELANIDPGVLRQRRARKLAQEHLAAAKVHLDANAPRLFFDEISKGALGYLSAKLHIERSQLSKNNVRGKLESLNVDPQRIDTFLHILQTCEVALFAGQSDNQSMQDIYEKTEEVITNIETALRS